MRRKLEEGKEGEAGLRAGVEENGSTSRECTQEITSKEMKENGCRRRGSEVNREGSKMEMKKTMRKGSERTKRKKW